VDEYLAKAKRDVQPHEPPFPETESEIQRYRNDLIDDAFERVGHEKDASDPVRISSLAELNEYSSEDDVHVKMEPGTYAVTRENVADLMTKNEALDYLGEKYGATLFNFDGENTYFDLRGVTITYDTRILNGHWAEPFDYNPEKDKPILFYITGANQVFRGLEVRGIEKEEWDERTYNPRGAGTWSTFADRVMLWDVSITSRGSFPYGYSSLLGKGGPSVVDISKHACFAYRGIDNYFIGVDLHPRTFGHVARGSDARAVFIECTVDGKIRPTDEILEETSGPAYENDFKSYSGNKIPPGVMISYHEDTFRSYRSNDFCKVLSCDISRTRGVATGNVEGLYMANCTMRENTRRAMTLNTNTEVVDCSADIRYSEAIESAPNTSNCTVDLDIVPSPTPDTLVRHSGSINMGEDLSGAAALIGGNGHDVTLRTESPGELRSSLSDWARPLPIIVGNYRGDTVDASHVTLRNETGLPVWLTKTASNCTIESNGRVEDNGSGNSITQI
jgi:hypothetical protein